MTLVNCIQCDGARYSCKDTPYKNATSINFVLLSMQPLLTSYAPQLLDALHS